MAPPEQHPVDHPAAEELAMVAVAPDDERLGRVREHVSTCAACAEEVSAMGAAVAPGPDGPARRLPPPSVWAGIAAATGVRSAPDEAALLRSLDDDAGGHARPGAAAVGATRAPGRDTPPAPAQPVRVGAPPPSSSAVPSRVPSRVPAQRSRQRWSTPVLLGAAGLALVVGATSGALVVSRTRDPGAAADPVAGAAVVSTAQLRPLAAGQGDWRGTAEVVVTSSAGEGRRVLVTTEGLPPVQGSAYEVWLLDAATGGVVSLGSLADGHSPRGGYVLPDGVDLARFSEVDVSTEPLDGDAAHSGTSELRGALTASASASTASA
ncbi:anti-sigma factor [Streptomyces sp. NP160]|uniref:anti-sigma factor n=1 Tax=Streptomyces sp. NP160 TaxID=2586637 RepID=UPI0011184338|nr:anti-sigma factor [Streptomyces sp. NP160]TNM59561.1 anti-sigma factor [Streptomyces sp. NP160]